MIKTVRKLKGDIEDVLFVLFTVFFVVAIIAMIVFTILIANKSYECKKYENTPLKDVPAKCITADGGTY